MTRRAAAFFPRRALSGAVIWNIVITHDCNKNCSYCRNQEADVPFPRDISYPVAALARFLAKDPDPVIAFYGGEPLLDIDMVGRVMDAIPARHYIVQTNGHFLDAVPPRILTRLGTILVSIDGTRETTDGYRGEGTHDTVLDNVRWLRREGFDGEITARMCISEQSDIHRDVSYLLGLHDDAGRPLFDGVHWQNDLMFDDREAWRDLDGWLARSYYPGIERLAGEWVDGMASKGEVRLVYPFVGLVSAKLSGTPAKLHCGCGHANNNICTDGRVTACPVSSDFYPLFELGTIFDNEPGDFVDAMVPGEPCTSCDIYNVCGGRCLYANVTKPWGEAGYAETCATIRHLVGTLEAALPRIKSLLASGTITRDQFSYFQYNGCEIVP